MRRCLWLAATLLLCALSAHVNGQTVRYIHDELGRLIAVIAPSGDAAVYQYDAAGNVLSIVRHTSGAVAIFDFTPKGAVVGTTVTLYGMGFSATASQNSVSFNGTSAAVTAATTTSITVTVPAGATTGTIAVTTPSGSATSSSSFVVGTSSAPAITSFSPSIGPAGTSVSLSGTNFDAILSQNKASLNITSASVSAGSTTSLTTSVPAATGSGRFVLKTLNGTATSSADFFVPPSPYATGDVITTGRLAFSTALNVSIGTASKIALVVFDGTADQRVGLKIVPGPISGVTLYRPNGTSLATHSTGIGTTLMEPPLLPIGGTYQFMLDPVGTGTGTTALTLYEIAADSTGTIQADGPAETVTNSVGQNGLRTFSGTSAQRVSLSVSSFSPSGTVSLLRPDGTSQASVGSGVAAVFMEPQTLATTGTYAIKVDPSHANTGTTTLSLFDVPPDVTGSITVGGSALNVTLDPGQKASITFTGTQGQAVTVRLTSNTIGTNNLNGSTTVTLLKPDGAQLTSSSSIATNFNLAQQTLAVSGTYTIVIDPGGAHSGSINVAVTNP